jgi:predicted metal-dependent hydrolase
MQPRETISRNLRRTRLGPDEVDYVLVRRRGRRGVGLKVDAMGLTVNAPVTMPLARIEAFLRESERWVLRKIAEWSARRAPEVRWEEGAQLPYLGRSLTLRLAAARRTFAERIGVELHVGLRDATAASARRAVVAWYKGAARDHLEGRVAELARAGGIALPRLVISAARSRWGSCNSRREIRFAWRLVKAPPHLVDYVVCHELAHLRQMNHSRAFWSEVERLCPDYRRLRAELLANDHLYRSF